MCVLLIAAQQHQHLHRLICAYDSQPFVSSHLILVPLALQTSDQALFKYSKTPTLSHSKHTPSVLCLFSIASFAPPHSLLFLFLPLRSSLHESSGLSPPPKSTSAIPLSVHLPSTSPIYQASLRLILQYSSQ
jgi:hypothetical protein